MENDLDRSLGFVIHDVTRLLRFEFDRQSQGLGLTRAQWSVLAHLERQQGVQQKDLAQVMDIKPITLARHLDRLEQNDWIERRDDLKDRRAKRVYLTFKTNPMIKLLREVGVKVRKQALQGFNSKEQAVLMEMLIKMRENLVVNRNQK